MKEYKLLPCPFCKSDNARLVNKHEDVFWGYCYAKCFNCGTRTRQGSLKEIAEYRDWETDRKSTRLNSSHSGESRMPSSA